MSKFGSPPPNQSSVAPAPETPQAGGRTAGSIYIDMFVKYAPEEDLRKLYDKVKAELILRMP